MAIQMRRGEYSKFDAESMLPGEWAIVLESDPNGTGGRSLYMCFSPGVVKRIATVEDMATIIAIATDANAAITDAEKKRVAAENSRVSAESARKQAETERANGWSDLKADAEKTVGDAVKRADSAADRAVQAASSASAAGDAATAAAAKAETDAKAAVDSASASVSKAVADAKADVDAAVGRADAATAKAETAVETANTANEAATKAVTDAQAAIAEVKATEAKLYPAAENILVGSETGAVVHVEDAFAGASLRGITVEGACKQDGTPSPDNPVPIEVIERPVVKVTGADTSAVRTSLPFTLPAEHPYLAKIGDVADEIKVDKDGNVKLVVNVGHMTLDEFAQSKNLYCLDDYELKNEASGVSSFRFYYDLVLPQKRAAICSLLPSTPNSWNKGIVGTEWVSGLIVRFPRGLLGISADDSLDTKVAKFRTYAADKSDVHIYYPLSDGAKKTYSLGKIALPALPESTSNVWTDAEVTPRTGIEYTRDVNIVVANLESAIASIS